MKKLINYSLLCFILLFCTACPYESVVPIDEAKMAIDEVFFGHWKEQNADKNFYSFLKLDNKHYLITENIFNETAQAFDKKEYSGHLSEVDGMLFFNLLGKKNSKNYVIYKVVLSADKKELTLSPLSEYIREKFTNSQDLRNFVSKNKNLSFFYAKEMILYRSK